MFLNLCTSFCHNLEITPFLNPYTLPAYSWPFSSTISAFYRLLSSIRTLLNPYLLSSLGYSEKKMSGKLVLPPIKLSSYGLIHRFVGSLCGLFVGAWTMMRPLLFDIKAINLQLFEEYLYFMLVERVGWRTCFSWCYLAEIILSLAILCSYKVSSSSSS